MNNETAIESREELLKNIENPTPIKSINNDQPKTGVAGISAVPQPVEQKQEAEKNNPAPSILDQKLSGTFKIPKVETNHSLSNMTKNTNSGMSKDTKTDPYREIPE